MLHAVWIPCALVVSIVWVAVPPRFCPAGQEAKFKFGFRRGDCIKCSPGKYKTVNGTRLCAKCPANHYSRLSGATSCRKCAEGSVSRIGSSQCDAPGKNACPIGKYDSGYLPEKCTKCQAGKYKNTSKAGELCVDCPENTYSNVGSSTCFLCPGGYVSKAASSRCEACLAGKYREEKQKGGCKPCPVNSYASTEGSSTCFLCPGGYVSKAASSHCDACPPGKYREENQPGGCKPCPVNTYAHREGTPDCHECPRGSVSKPSRDSCSKCSQNTFAYGNGTCLPCYEGSLSGQGSIRCWCKQGWEVPLQIANASTSRDAMWKDLGGYHCVQCPPNTYKDIVGNEQCQNCPRSSTASPGSTDLMQCTASTFTVISYAVTGSDDAKVRRWIEEQKRVALQQAASTLQNWVDEAVDTVIAHSQEFILAIRSFCAELFGTWEAFEKAWRELFTSCPDGGTHCYLSDTTGCCWTCEDVKAAFERKGWPDWWRTPLCGNRSEAPDEGGADGERGCPTNTESEFTAWLEATELYTRFSKAHKAATRGPSAKTCRAAKQWVMKLMLQVHPDKYDATHPGCPRGISTVGAQRVNSMWSSLSGGQCKPFLRG